MEQAIGAELEALGFSPLTPPGALRSVAERLLGMAEVFDRTTNAAAMPPLDRQIAAALAEARQAARPALLSDPDQAEAEVSDFVERQRRRREGEG